MLNWALKYQRLGMSVIPLKPGEKTPLLPSWKEYQNRRPTEAEILAWWTKCPNANVGIVTGLISGVAVVDLDGPEGLKQAESLGLKSRVSSITGRGKHLWYRTESVISNAVRTYPGIDIRGDGGYVVAPPSLHPNGQRYRFVNALQLGTLPPFPVKLSGVSEAEKPETKTEGWISTALKEMKHGNIDDTLFTICSRLRRDGYTPDDARLFLSAAADKAGATPGHLDDKIKNVWARYEPNREPIQHRSNTSESMGSQLIIHNPTNPDDLKHFRDRLSMVGVDDTQTLRTGYGKLDQMLKGGLKSSRLFTVAARTGVGKTNWLLGATRTLCLSGKKVLLFSTEMPYAQIWERYIAALDDPQSFDRHKFFVCDSFAPNLEKVEEALNEIKPDVFMFDHINHVAEDPRELGTFMQGLNFLRRKYDTSGIITAQLNRAADWVDVKTGEKITPRMSMIKGSGTIEQASSRVLLLSETRVTPEYTEIVGNLDKNDNGPKGLIHFGLFTSPYHMAEL